jgi:hypothetical protein
MRGAALRRPPLFAGVVTLVYAALALAAPLMRNLDASAFILAGDRFVDAAAAPAPLSVKRDADGYDGQFYYRVALRPWSFAAEFDGVRFDDPAYRMQRIVYPALAWAASLGRPALVPIALFCVNLVGVGAVAALAALLCTAAGIPSSAAVAIVMWPGFIVTLTHDTTEIVATAFLLAALLARARRRPAAYGALAAAAMLARETTSPLFVGMLLCDAWAALARKDRAWAAAGALAVLPMLAWHETLRHIWQGASGGSGLMNLGLPFAGALRALIRVAAHGKPLGPTPAKDLAMRGIVLSITAAIVAVGVLAVSRLRVALRRPGLWPPLAVGWCLTAALMSLLTADGPWIDVTAFTRAFTEFYVVGCLVVAGGGWRTSRPVALGLAGGVMLAAVWLVCTSQLRAA